MSNIPGKVYISANDGLIAETSADGNIYISYKWVESIDGNGISSGDKGKEDTFAALLAHELAHVLLGHHNSLAGLDRYLTL